MLKTAFSANLKTISLRKMNAIYYWCNSVFATGSSSHMYLGGRSQM